MKHRARFTIFLLPLAGAISCEDDTAAPAVGDASVPSLDAAKIPDSAAATSDAQTPDGAATDAATDSAMVDAATDAADNGPFVTGLDEEGNLVRVSLSPTGTDTLLVKPVIPTGFDLIAIARNVSQLYGYANGQSGDPTLFLLSETSTTATPAPNQFPNGGSGRPILGATGDALFTIDQYSPLRSISIANGNINQALLTTTVPGTDGGQCHTPLDLIGDAFDTLLVAATCAGGTFGVAQRSVATVRYTPDAAAYETPIGDVPKAVLPDGGGNDIGALVGLTRHNGTVYAATARFLFKRNSVGVFELLRRYAPVTAFGQPGLSDLE